MSRYSRYIGSVQSNFNAKNIVLFVQDWEPNEARPDVWGRAAVTDSHTTFPPTSGEEGDGVQTPTTTGTIRGI